MEAFRAPLVEGFAVYLINNRVISKAHFSTGAEGRPSLFAEGRDRFIRAWEHWLARPVLNPRKGGPDHWRGLIEDDVLAFRAAAVSGGDFHPYRMDY
jgi:CRISPR/Cas system-associated endonuclease Cas1